jgi:hypothetical protein
MYRNDKGTLYTSQEELVNTEPVASKQIGISMQWHETACAKNYLMLFKDTAQR